MKKNPLLYSYNMRGVPVNHNRMLESIAFVVRTINSNPSLEIICLQEMVFGKSGYYKNHLMEKLSDWDLIAPKYYMPDVNWRSAISAILLKRGTWSHKMLEIPTCSDRPDLDFSNLYNYLLLEKNNKETGFTENFKLLNLHCVNRAHKDNLPKEYVMGRLALAEWFWESINQEVIVNTENIIVAGDLNAEENEPNYDLLCKSVEDTYIKQRWKYTYVSPGRGKHRYDHVLTNFNKGYSIIDPAPLVEKISDHTGMFYYAG